MSGRPHRLAAALGAALLALWLGAVAFALRAADHETGTLVVLFRPGAAPLAEASPGAEGARAAWLPFARVVTSDEPRLAGRLRRDGALAVFRTIPFSPAIGGCMIAAGRHEAHARPPGAADRDDPRPRRPTSRRSPAAEAAARRPRLAATSASSGAPAARPGGSPARRAP